jgi:glycosyltransferase involved in cell wall biosynthesis
MKPLDDLSSSDRDRGDCAVVVVGDEREALASALASVLARTSRRIPLVIIAGPEARDVERDLPELGADGAREVFHLEPSGAGTTAAVQRAVDALAPVDVALLGWPCLVAPGWLERLRLAAYSESTCASASALADAGTQLAVDGANDEAGRREKAGEAPGHDKAAAAVAERSLLLRPRLDAVAGPCAYLRRSALELAGPLDAELDLRWALEVDFAQRCVLKGLQHVAADDVLVGRVTGPPGPHDPPPVLRERYPYLAWPPVVTESPTLGRALAVARPAESPLSVTIDARALGPTVGGTQTHILELICALDEAGQADLRVVVAPDLADQSRARLEHLAHAELLPIEDVTPDTEPTGVVHRPHQVFGPSDLDLLVSLGRRAVVSQLDLIAYRNPGYFPDRGAWLRYQRVAREALAAADRVIVFSRHTLDDMQADELIEPERARIVPPGIDHAGPPEERPPGGLSDRLPEVGDGEQGQGGGGAPYLLCLGTDFAHKNRVFALALLHELSEAHGWTGRLIMAGTHIPHGSSQPEESEFLARHPDLGRRVQDLGAVEEAEKAWLMSHAAAVVYPSVYEGFGLVPFEAARAGVPCLFAAQSSLAEILPRDASTLVAWSPALSATAVLPLLEDPRARSAHVKVIRDAGSKLTWRRAAAEIIEVYREAIVAPSRAGLAVSRDHVRREHEIDRLRAAHAEEVAQLLVEREEARRLYWGLREEAGYGLSLIGRRGSLPDEVQRALLALSARPTISRPLYGAAAAAYRAARAAYRRSSGGRGSTR